MTTDHDLLVETHTLVKEVHKAVYGNGQPGLVQDVAGLKVITADVDKRAPSNKEKAAAWSAIAVAFIMALGPIIVALVS